MGNHDCLCLLGKCFLELCNIDVVLRDRHVNEDRNSAVLDRRGNGRRETCRNSDDLVSALYAAVAEQRGGQGHECYQVCGRARVYKSTVAHMEVLRKLLLELIRVASGCEPELQGTVHKVYHLFAVVHAGRIRDAVSLMELLFLVMEFIGIFSYEVKDLFSCLCFCLILKHNFSFPVYSSTETSPRSVCPSQRQHRRSSHTPGTTPP